MPKQDNIRGVEDASKLSEADSIWPSAWNEALQPTVNTDLAKANPFTQDNLALVVNGPDGRTMHHVSELVCSHCGDPSI